MFWCCNDEFCLLLSNVSGKFLLNMNTYKVNRILPHFLSSLAKLKTLCISCLFVFMQRQVKDLAFVNNCLCTTNFDSFTTHVIIKAGKCIANVKNLVDFIYSLVQFTNSQLHKILSRFHNSWLQLKLTGWHSCRTYVFWNDNLLFLIHNFKMCRWWRHCIG